MEKNPRGGGIVEKVGDGGGGCRWPARVVENGCQLSYSQIKEKIN